MIQLNLLPDVKKEFIQTQRLKRNIISGAILASFVAVGLIVLLALYVHVAQRVARNQLQGDIEKSESSLNSQQDLSKILTVQGALMQLPSLHDKKPISSRLFDYLKVLIPNEVTLNKLEEDQAKSTMKLDGISTDYKSLNVFVDTLKNAKIATGAEDKRTEQQAFNKVTIVSANASNDTTRPGVSFSLSMEFNPAMFKASSENPKMEVPNVNTGSGFTTKTNDVFGSGAKQ